MASFDPNITQPDPPALSPAPMAGGFDPNIDQPSFDPNITQPEVETPPSEHENQIRKLALNKLQENYGGPDIKRLLTVKDLGKLKEDQRQLVRLVQAANTLKGDPTKGYTMEVSIGGAPKRIPLEELPQHLQGKVLNRFMTDMKFAKVSATKNANPTLGKMLGPETAKAKGFLRTAVNIPFDILSLTGRTSEAVVNAVNNLTQGRSPEENLTFETFAQTMAREEVDRSTAENIWNAAGSSIGPVASAATLPIRAIGGVLSKLGNVGKAVGTTSTLGRLQAGARYVGAGIQNKLLTPLKDRISQVTEQVSALQTGVAPAKTGIKEAFKQGAPGAILGTEGQIAGIYAGHILASPDLSQQEKVVGVLSVLAGNAAVGGLMRGIKIRGRTADYIRGGQVSKDEVAKFLSEAPDVEAWAMMKKGTDKEVIEKAVAGLETRIKRMGRQIDKTIEKTPITLPQLNEAFKAELAAQKLSPERISEIMKMIQDINIPLSKPVPFSSSEIKFGAEKFRAQFRDAFGANVPKAVKNQVDYLVLLKDRNAPADQMSKGLEELRKRVEKGLKAIAPKPKAIRSEEPLSATDIVTGKNTRTVTKMEADPAEVSAHALKTENAQNAINFLTRATSSAERIMGRELTTGGILTRERVFDALEKAGASPDLVGSVTRAMTTDKITPTALRKLVLREFERQHTVIGGAKPRFTPDDWTALNRGLDQLLETQPSQMRNLPGGAGIPIRKTVTHLSQVGKSQSVMSVVKDLKLAEDAMKAGLALKTAVTRPEYIGEEASAAFKALNKKFSQTATDKKSLDGLIDASAPDGAIVSDEATRLDNFANKLVASILAPTRNQNWLTSVLALEKKYGSHIIEPIIAKRVRNAGPSMSKLISSLRKDPATFFEAAKQVAGAAVSPSTYVKPGTALPITASAATRIRPSDVADWTGIETVESVPAEPGQPAEVKPTALKFKPGVEKESPATADTMSAGEYLQEMLGVPLTVTGMTGAVKGRVEGTKHTAGDALDLVPTDPKGYASFREKTKTIIDGLKAKGYELILEVPSEAMLKTYPGARVNSKATGVHFHVEKI